MLMVAPVVRAALQFDVFLGYDGIVPESSWFPVVCEIKNDGPSFKGTIVCVPAAYGQGQVRRIEVELPTGTLKRIVLPIFMAAQAYSSWDVRLLDERGKMRAEQLGLRPRRQIAAQVPLIGALARTPAGAPVLRPILPKESEIQPASARLLPPILPDNPLVLEGMSCLYLNSEKAPELSVGQVNALLAWLHAGGHLMVAVEQVTDINSTPWLRSLFPCDLKEMRAISGHPELQEWLRSSSWRTNEVQGFRRAPRPQRSRGAPPPPESTPVLSIADLPDDLAFETAEMQVAVGQIRDGRVEVAAGNVPLIVSAPRGRGRVTALLFSPEREPFRSWKNLPTFWARMAEVPLEWYLSSDFQRGGTWSTDAIFGALIDSRQVHKLPIEWLLLLLVVYLVVIGPLDQYWLKKVRRPMLTWITFPCYVVLFSAVIYVIGYKLRAGESEWNELHVVDVLRRGDQAELRGRTYSSVYAPSNQRYTLEGHERVATIRSEVSGWRGSQSSDRTEVLQKGDTFAAQVYVPVWTSQLLVSDWWQSAPVPVEAGVVSQPDGWSVAVRNNTDRKLTDLNLAIAGLIAPLGDVAPGERRVFRVSRASGTPIASVAAVRLSGFRNAAQWRQHAFGSADRGRLSELAANTLAVSFLSAASPSKPQDYSINFASPPGLDLAPVVEQGSAVVFAWADDFSPTQPMYRFTPRRSHKSTMWRVIIETPGQAASPLKPEA
jgi:hypothetical protein